MNQIKLSNIQWDCDTEDEVKSLPKEVTIKTHELPDYVWDDLEEAIGDYLAKKYGYCNEGYCWEFTTGGKK